MTPKQIERFWSHVEKTPDGCWTWLGARCGDYGRVNINRKSLAAHRVAWIITNGPIPIELIVRHKCDNGSCVRPDHLELGTYKENSRDMVLRGRTNGPKGERAGNHKLKRNQVSEIKAHLLNGTKSQAQLSRDFTVGRNTITAIRLNLSWRSVPPLLPDELPNPSRRFTDADYLLIRGLWRDGGWTLRQLAERFECRVDVIQAILSGKRGTGVPVGKRIIRQNSTKLSEDVRRLIKRRVKAGESQISMAREYGMSKNGIWNLINGL